MNITELYSDYRIHKFTTPFIPFEPIKGPDTSLKRKERKERARKLTEQNLKCKRCK